MAALAAAVFVLWTGSAAQADAPDGTIGFDDQPLGQVPRGCVTPQGAAAGTVSDARGYLSRKSLRIQDTRGDAMTKVDCPGAAHGTDNLALQVFPAAIRGGLLIDFTGRFEGIAQRRQVFHLAVFGDGRIAWYDGRTWLPISRVGAVRIGAWNHLAAQVSADHAAVLVYVDGHYVGEGGPNGIRPVQSIDGYQFSSGGTAVTGDDIFIDNVLHDPQRRSPARETGGLELGNHTVIDRARTPLQMPDTAVRAGGGRILAGYPAHGDDSASAGNRFAYSDDQGASWHRAPAMNPMPGAASTNLTRLHDGSLLALDYHTYLRADRRRANIDSAISRDGGRTWQRRTGTLSTPEPMRSIADVTDRPGHPLGGFVLVHSAIENRDGSLYQSAYGYYRHDRKYRQLLLRSTDRGRDWTVRATLAMNPGLSADPGYEGFCEAGIERTGDGSLLAVLRTGSYRPLYTSRSTDEGRTWSTPRQLRTPPDSRPAQSVYPVLARLDGGTLALLIGRPGLALLTSADNGHTWTRPVAIDYPDSANGTLLPLGGKRVLVFGDRGANWSAPKPETYTVCSRPVRIR
ncbi:sialidase family protein [Sciscionella sediminilitoris]|uniref:sialidase family protein n=1 Tax=Sciscionella sediminilitoris TaxID=1445613 RepID=UPI0004DF4C34|nr:sialidase family protein [Sciscionella sp. SE31]